ncbi:hypothetical protein [Paeniglutamicibacter antarcticus]|uniref:MBG domain-containing protein n=1 Tax=Paeniglutamicibacter antarcticus TaxID=494023 RepID=A0ABP9THH2_9MICC
MGSTLTAAPGTWGPIGVALAYQWSADGTAIKDATRSTFDLDPNLAGKAITVAVTGTKAGYTTATKASKATAQVALRQFTTPPVPTISGTVTVGSTLTAIPGNWGPVDVLFQYQWYRDGTYLPSATDPTYQLTAADLGKRISVLVEGSKAGYDHYPMTSADTAKVGSTIKRVTPAAPTSVAATGRYTVPSSEGVFYQVNGISKAAGTYASGYTKMNIIALTKPGYTLSGTTSWVLDLSKKPVAATAPSINYTDKSITLPRTTGVDYSIDGVLKAAGTHKVTTYATVTAKASAPNYTVAAKTWKYDLRTAVTPTKPVFSASANTVKIPAKTGVTYYVNNVLKKAGTHKYTGSGTITTKASSGSYKLTGTTSWKFDNRNAVTPTKPVFSASANTVKIPAKTGVTYYVNNVLKKTGTHKYTGAVTVTTKVSNGSYKLAGIQKWTARL